MYACVWGCIEESMKINVCMPFANWLVVPLREVLCFNCCVRIRAYKNVHRFHFFLLSFVRFMIFKFEWFLFIEHVLRYLGCNFIVRVLLLLNSRNLSPFYLENRKLSVTAATTNNTNSVHQRVWKDIVQQDVIVTKDLWFVVESKTSRKATHSERVFVFVARIFYCSSGIV